MPEAQNILQRFDISPTASKVYMALLELGKASADNVAKKVKTYKANVYDALARLEEVGLVTTIIEENKRLFIPTNPKKLKQMVDEKREQETTKMDDFRRELEEILPQLRAKYESIKSKDLFEIYRGRKAYKAIISEILDEHPSIWKGFGNFQIQALFPEFKRWFHTIPMRLFSTKSEIVLRRWEEAKKVTKVEVKWLPKEIYMPIVWVIFGNNLLIVIYEPEIIVLRIKSKQIVETFSNQLDYLWKKY